MRSADRSGSGFQRTWRIIFLLCATGTSLWRGQLHSQTALTGERDASKFSGRSIIEQIQAAIHDCGKDPCAVYVPAGNYNASAIPSWQTRDTTGSRVGIAIPSNVEIRGAGRGLTIINVTRSALDPSATLFANANKSNRNIRLRDMTITWTDADSKFDWVSIFVCHACEQLELDHLRLEGNPNKLVNLLDSTGSSVHDNTFVPRTTSYGHGDNALSVCRFEPGESVGDTAGVVRDNQFIHAGNFRTFSMLVVCQSGLYVHDNVFEGNFPSPGNATGIESGQDNLARLPEHVKISANVFHGASIAYGGTNNSEISGNFLDHGDIYVAVQSGTIASLSGVTIADNEVHFGSISVGGIEHTYIGRFLVTRNRVFDGSIGTGNSLLVHDIEVSFNSVRYSKNNNGIDCNSCAVIKGNVVREIGQNAPGDVHAGYLIGGSVNDVSDNVYIDYQHTYDVGTICSVAKPSSVLCLPSGSSRWVLLRGGEWGVGWTNRTLLAENGPLVIHAFVNSVLLELEADTPALPAGTHYHLYRTTFNAFELNSATIGRFANNLAISNGGYRHAAVQENGVVRIQDLFGNVFRPYSCVGKCAVDYRSTVNAPE
ncbi:MAG: hypothetical protein WB729_02065 [Candidatus Sulfotelmatobacter sp.]